MTYVLKVNQEWKHLLHRCLDFTEEEYKEVVEGLDERGRYYVSNMLAHGWTVAKDDSGYVWVWCSWSKGSVCAPDDTEWRKYVEDTSWMDYMCQGLDQRAIERLKRLISKQWLVEKNEDHSVTIRSNPRHKESDYYDIPNPNPPRVWTIKADKTKEIENE